MVISSQYRNPLNFNAETLQAAKNSLKRIDKVIESLKTISGDDETNAKYDDVIQEATIEFEKAMSDDLNSPKGNAALFKLVNAAEKAIKINSVDKCTAEKFLNAFENMDRVYGILYEVPEKYLTKKTSTSDAVNSKDYEVAYQLGEKRKERKAAKDYGAADSLRDQIIALGYGIKDTKDGFDLFLMNSNY